MKIQTLAVIFVIIILPISLVFASYTQGRVETVNLQTRYDSKLNDATYDALKAYQLNNFNSDSSDYVNAKMRDIKASANTFFNSMASAFSELGYTKETLQNYVPALVYAMYDGYYIYSSYTNTWDSETINKHSTDESYHNDEKLYGIKPYVYYSCRYKGTNYDVTITYSLDNYIQIQGYVMEGSQKKTVSKYGYLLNKKDLVINGDNVEYKGVSINKENSLKENIYVDGQIRGLSYIKKNGTKYYYDNENGADNVFSVINGKKIIQNDEELKNEIQNNDYAQKYYKESKDLMDFMQNYGLDEIKISNIVDENGNQYNTNDENGAYHTSGKIFDFDDDIESETSNFNTHRIEVIKHSIERNLSIAISNFNAFSSFEFQMPKLKDEDWDKIMDNISIISFLQGVNIGGKIYNGYSIVTNTKNEDLVMQDSIYIKDASGIFHRITENSLPYQDGMIGIYNVNIERRTTQDTDGSNLYYFPVDGTLSYNSIVTQNNISKTSTQTLSDYINGLDNRLKQIYYTALGRERYSLYRARLEI